MRPSPDPDTRVSSFRDASMEFDSVYGLLARSCGLSGTEYWALVLIREGVVTQREISEQLSLSRQTLNSAFKLLIKKGLIRLEPLEHDQRSKRAILTQAGAGLAGPHRRGPGRADPPDPSVQRRPAVRPTFPGDTSGYLLIGGPVIAITLVREDVECARSCM